MVIILIFNYGSTTTTTNNLLRQKNQCPDFPFIHIHKKIHICTWLKNMYINP